MVKTIEQLNREFLNDFTFESPKEEQTPVSNMPVDAVIEQKETVEDKPIASVPKKSPAYQPLWRDLLFLILKIALILLAFAAMFTFLFGFVRYGEPSMSPAIKDGDLVVYYRYTKAGYLTQDAIVLKHEGQAQVRRVVAIEGDVVDITEDGFYVNGSIQQEPGIFQETERYVEGVSFPLIVPQGHIFVLGDSRKGATDSRIYGTVEIDETLGKVMAVISRRSI